jgi:hypothetical protein
MRIGSRPEQPSQIDCQPKKFHWRTPDFVPVNEIVISPAPQRYRNGSVTPNIDPF